MLFTAPIDIRSKYANTINYGDQTTLLAIEKFYANVSARTVPLY